MKKMLLVTYVFPPYAAVGVYRILKFCKYLRDFGIEPVILTPSKPNVRMRHEQLLSQVPRNVSVHRTPSLEPFRWRESAASTSNTPSQSAEPKPAVSHRPGVISRLKGSVKRVLSVPDQQYFWIWTGLWQGVNAARKEKIDLVLSSSPPPSTHVLGSRIASLTGRPHLVDFRDLWTQNTSYAKADFPEYLQRRDRNFEERVLRRAAGISVNTETFKNQLLQKNSFLGDDRIEVVTNGVDPDDFRPHLATIKPNDKFTILYTGSIYGDHRNPEFFLDAIRRWLEADPEVASKIRLEFIGNMEEGFVHLFEKYRLGDIIVRRGWLPQSEVISASLSADLLLLIQGFDPVLSAAVPRKLYEYMIANRPILAFAPPGEIPNLISRYDCGLCLSDPNPEPITDYLRKSFANWEREHAAGNPGQRVLRSMPELETAAQVEKLAAMAERLMK